MRGIVFDIKRGGVKDGPGLRTSVFLKGCPLRCAWCHNPESQLMRPEKDANGSMCGKEMSVEEVMDEVLPDSPFYASSGGGVTITGGEPLAQPAFALAIAKVAKEAGIHVALDTCGHAPWETLAPFLPMVDLFLYDVKASDPVLHKKLTGVDNALIMSNLEKLNDADVHIFLRCPMVPGVNDDKAHLEAIARLAERLSGVDEVTIEPYHPVGLEKYRRFGRTPKFSSSKFPTKELCADWLTAIGTLTKKRVVLA